jgi:hypothetical protein
MVSIQELDQNSDNNLLTFAFSLYGNRTMYLEGLRYSINYLTDYCPEKFSVWVYHDDSVPESFLKEIQHCPFVKLIDCSNCGFCSIGDLRAAWRFMALEEPTLDRVVVCDIDCQEVSEFIEKYYDIFLEKEKQRLPLILYNTPSWTHSLNNEEFSPRISANLIVKSGFVFRGMRKTISGLLPIPAKTNRGKRIGYGQDEKFLDTYVFPLLGSLQSVDMSLINTKPCYYGTRTRSKSEQVLEDVKNKRKQL